MKPWTPELKLLRPLLWLTCEQLDACVAEKRLPHREDHSNQSRDYTRNRLRHDVLGELAKINPQVVEHLWSLSGDMADLRTSSAPEATEFRATNNETVTDKNAKFKIRTAEIKGLQALGNFLEPACEEHQISLSRGFLNNLLDHLHKLVAGRNQHQRYIFALSEKLSLIMTHKHLEIKVTS
jgi:tRNA(Ile)-lysidine synthase TilS/MesJ